MAAKFFSVNALALLALVAGCVGLLILRSAFFADQLAATVPAARPATAVGLTVCYHERRPYYYREGTRVTGLVAERTAAALHLAGIEFHWELLPPSRQLELVRSAATPCAAIGWFATEERKTFARFSEPVYQDAPFVALASASNARVPPSLALEDLFANADLALLVKDTYSYGDLLDQRIAAMRARRVPTPAGNAAMLQMLAAGRADLMLVAPEEALELISSVPAGSTTFRIVKLTGMPAGATRHVMFSRAVPEETVRRFNHALRRLPGGSTGGNQ